MQVHLPPLLASDFVVHYRDTDFHVHKFVLHHHSGYFRNHLSVTAPVGKVEKDDVVREGGKRRRVTTSIIDEVSWECRYLAYVLCIHLPHDFGDGRPVGVADFLLFLRHCTSLRLSSSSRSHPRTPSQDAILDSLSVDSPISLAVPTDSLISGAVIHEYFKDDAAAPRRSSCSEPLPSLFHYFDCQEMQRSEQVIVRGSLSYCMDAWYWLPLVVRYKMKAVEDACIEKLGRNKSVERRVHSSEFLDKLGRLPLAVIAA